MDFLSKLMDDGLIFAQADENSSQDKLNINPAQADVDTVINSNGKEAACLYGDTGALLLGNTTVVDGVIAGAPNILRVGGADTQVCASIYCFSDTDAHRGRLDFYRSGSDTYGTKTDATADAILGQIAFYGVDSGNAWDFGAYFNVVQIAAAGATIPCDMVFVGSTNAATAEYMRIKSGGQVIIGLPDTADALPLLRVWKATAGAVDSNTDAVATFESNADMVIDLLTPNNNFSGLNFGDPEDNNVGYLTYAHASDTMTFGVAAASVMTLTTSGLNITGAAVQLHVHQTGAAGAVPVLTLEQADIDQPIMKIIGSSEDAINAKRTLVPAAGVAVLGAAIGYYLVEIQDDNGGSAITDGTYYVPVYNPTLTCH